MARAGGTAKRHAGSTAWKHAGGCVRASAGGTARERAGSAAWTSAGGNAGPPYRSCIRSPLRRRGVTVLGLMSSIHEPVCQSCSSSFLCEHAVRARMSMSHTILQPLSPSAKQVSVWHVCLHALTTGCVLSSRLILWITHPRAGVALARAQPSLSCCFLFFCLTCHVLLSNGSSSQTHIKKPN